jgi:hypothetical protein
MHNAVAEQIAEEARLQGTCCSGRAESTMGPFDVLSIGKTGAVLAIGAAKFVARPLVVGEAGKYAALRARGAPARTSVTRRYSSLSTWDGVALSVARPCYQITFVP